MKGIVKGILVLLLCVALMFSLCGCREKTAAEEYRDALKKSEEAHQKANEAQKKYNQLQGAYDHLKELEGNLYN